MTRCRQLAAAAQSLLRHGDGGEFLVGLRYAAEAGMGLALLPCCIGDLAPGLVRARGFEETVVTPVWVATHKDLVDSATVQSIMAWFTDAVRQDADLHEGRLVRQ